MIRFGGSSFFNEDGLCREAVGCDKGQMEIELVAFVFVTTNIFVYIRIVYFMFVSVGRKMFTIFFSYISLIHSIRRHLHIQSS